MSNLRPTLIAAALSVIVAGGCAKPGVEKAETEAPVPVTVEPARVETLTATITATGVVTAAPGGDWTITAPGPARIVEIPKAENDPVHVGDLLVRFDMPSLTADLNARKADLAQATSRLNTAKDQLVRETNLLSQGVTAQREVNAAKQDVVDAESALQTAQSAVTANQDLSDRLVVRAKFDGVVAKRWHNPGEMVDASAGDPILRVINPTQLQVVASVPMSVLGRIIVGRPAKVIGPGGGDGEDATVTAKPAQVDPTSPTADVRLTFAKPTDLPAGAVVQVDITAEIRPNVVTVLTASIVYDEGDIFVMGAGADNRAHKYPVVLGFATHDRTEIKNGVSAGLPVIIRGQDGLPDGGAIVIQK